MPSCDGLGFGVCMAGESEFCGVYVTTSDIAEARELARMAVGKRLAACANIVPTVESIYWWDGAVQNGNECLLLFKTRCAIADTLVEAIKSNHSYECPCVVILPIEGGNPD